MDEPTPEVEYALDQTIDELLGYDYGREHRTQGLFLLAIDLNEYLESEPYTTDFEKLYQKTREGQPEWVIDQLDRADLPLGFAESAVRGNIELVPLDDSRVDHEWLLYPGDDFFEMLIRQYYPVICGRMSIQSLAEQTKSDKNIVRDGAFLLLGSMGGGGVPWVPIAVLLAWHLIEENVDQVCDEYEPY